MAKEICKFCECFFFLFLKVLKRDEDRKTKDQHRKFDNLLSTDDSFYNS